MPKDTVKIRVLKLQDLVKPVNKLNVRITPQSAENRRTLNRFIADFVEFAKESSSTHFSHVSVLSLQHCRSNPVWTCDITSDRFITILRQQSKTQSLLTIPDSAQEDLPNNVYMSVF